MQTIYVLLTDHQPVNLLDNSTIVGLFSTKNKAEEAEQKRFLRIKTDRTMIIPIKLDPETN